MSGSSTVCHSCGTPLEGDYCHRCGEKQLGRRDKSLRYFLEETIAALFFADGKFPRTLKCLLLYPARLPRSYILGVRKKYLSPIQLFFFTNLVYFLVPLSNSFDSTLYIQLNMLPYSEWVQPIVEQHISEEGIRYEDYEDSFNAKSTSNSKLMLVVMVGLLGVMLQLLFLRRKEYYLVDFLTAAACLMSFFLLFVLVALPGFVLLLSILLNFDRSLFFQEFIVTGVSLGLLFIYSFFLIRGTFHTTTAGSLWRSFVLMGLIVPCMFVYRFLLFWVTYWSV